MKRMADSETGQLAGGARQNWISLGLMVVVGAIALASLYMGFREYGDNNIETAFMYILIGVSASSGPNQSQRKRAGPKKQR